MPTVPGLLVMTDRRIGSAGLTLSVAVAELTIADQRGGTVLLTEAGG